MIWPIGRPGQHRAACDYLACGVRGRLRLPLLGLPIQHDLGARFDGWEAWANDVAVAFQVWRRSGWKSGVAGAWGTAARPRPRPVFFPVQVRKPQGRTDRSRLD